MGKKRYEVKQFSDNIYIIRLTHWWRRLFCSLDENELAEALSEISKIGRIQSVVKTYRWYDRYVVVLGNTLESKERG